MNTPAETTMDKIFNTPVPLTTTGIAGTTAAGPAATKRKRGEVPNTEADVFPGTRWHGRRASSSQYTAVVKSHPFQADGRTYLRAAVTGKITRNGTQLVSTFLSEFGRDPDDKQDPGVLALEKAASKQHAGLAAITITQDATIVTPGTPADPIVVGEIRSSAGTGAVDCGTITRVRILSRAVSEPDAYVIEAGWPSVVPNDQWKGIATADDIRRHWPIAKSGAMCAVLPPRVCSVDMRIPEWLTTRKITPSQVVRGQVRSTGGILAGSVTKIYVGSDADSAGRYKVIPRYPSVVDRPSWEVMLTAAEIASTWPNVTGVMSIAWDRGATVDPTEYKSPKFTTGLTEIVPEPVKLGQGRGQHSLDQPVLIASFLAGSSQYVVRSPTNGQGPSAVEILTADEIEHAYPVVLEQPGPVCNYVVPGQFRDGMPGFIARVEVVGYNPCDDMFVLRAATPRDTNQSEWCHRFTTAQILTKWPKLSVVQGPVDEATYSPDPRITIGESRTVSLTALNVKVVRYNGETHKYVVTGDGPLEIVWQMELTADEIVTRWGSVVTAKPEPLASSYPSPAKIKTAIVEALGHAEHMRISQVAETVCGDIGCSALDVLKWGDDLITNNEIEPIEGPGAGTFWRVTRPRLNGTGIANAIINIVRDAGDDGISVTRALATLRGNLEIDPVGALVVARELIDDGKIHMVHIDGTCTWNIGPGVHNGDTTMAKPQTEDDQILAALDGWTANRLRYWAKSMPHDIHGLYGVGDVTVPVRIAQVIRVLVVRANREHGRESKGFVQ